MQTANAPAICHECALSVKVDSMTEGQQAACPRCGYVISRRARNAARDMAVYSITAMIALVFANCFTFIGLSVQGREHSLTIVHSIAVLFSEGHWGLGIIIVLAIVILPLLFAISLNLLLLAVAYNRTSIHLFALLRAIKAFQFWNMAEIYFLGILVSIVKVASLADVNLGPSMWFFALFCVAQLAAMQRLDCFALANQVRELVARDLIADPLPKPPQGDAIRCPHCGAGQPADSTRCGLCQAQVAHHKPQSLQRTWLYLITGILLYIPANVMPIMFTTTLGKAEPSTIVGGVLLLWEHGSYPIATVIFVASIAVPIGKFLLLLALLASVQLRLPIHPAAQTAAYRFTEFIGRWSMVDVFVVAFLAGLIQLGNLMSILPGPAVIAFAGMVVATMLAAESFDPKLIWENHKFEQ